VGLFGGTLSFEVECFKAEEKLCAYGVDMRTTGEGSIKSNTEELEGEVECKEGWQSV